MECEDIINNIMAFYIDKTLLLINNKWNITFWKNEKCVKIYSHNKHRQTIINNIKYIPHSIYLEKCFIKLNIPIDIKKMYHGKNLRKLVYSACRNGSLFFIQMINFNENRKILNITKCCVLACRNNHLDIINYFYVNKIIEFIHIYAITRISLENEHLPIIKFISNKLRIDIMFKLYAYTNIETLEYINTTIPKNESIFIKTCSGAIRNGNIDVLKYLHKSIKFTLYKESMPYMCNFAAIKYLNEEKLIDKHSFLHSNTKEYDYTHIININVDIIKYLHKKMYFDKKDFINLHYKSFGIIRTDIETIGPDIKNYLSNHLNFDDKELSKFHKFFKI